MSGGLVFDCDGVLVDGEQSGHLLAFNEMWRRLGIPWRWTTDEYTAKLSIAGGKERLASLRTDARFKAVVGVPDSADDWLALVRHWHRLKTDIYMDLVRSGKVQARPGVRRLAQEAVDAGWRVAVASSGARDAVELVVRHALGEQLAQAAVILAGDSVTAKKPSPEVYLQAALRMGIDASRCIVIEDSEAGLQAALNAGMQCIVTATAATARSNFTGASAVLSALGPTHGAPMRVMSNAAQVPIEAELTLQGLKQFMRMASARHCAAGE